MKMDITTGRLPLQFLMIGAVMIAMGLWVIWDRLPTGIFLLIIGSCAYFKSGITIDFDNKRLKEYIGGIIFKKGKWKDITSANKLEIRKSSWSQENNVQTISTVTTVPTSSLYLILPDKKIQLMQGKKQRVLKKAEKIASLLNIPLENFNS